MEVICMTCVYTLFPISQNFGNRTESNRQKNKWKFLFSGDTALSVASLGCQKYKRVENTIRCIHEGKVLWDILKNKDRNTIPSSGSPWRAGFQAWKVLPEAVSALAPTVTHIPQAPISDCSQAELHLCIHCTISVSLICIYVSMKLIYNSKMVKLKGWIFLGVQLRIFCCNFTYFLVCITFNNYICSWILGFSKYHPKHSRSVNAKQVTHK